MPLRDRSPACPARVAWRRLTPLFAIAVAVLAPSLAVAAGEQPAGANEPPLRCRLIGDSPLGEGQTFAWVGGSWVERMQEHDDLELALTVRWRSAKPSFRNLGWGGDTVRGESRAVFGQPDDGYQRLLSDLDVAAPDVVILGYGANEAFEGADGKAEFLARYERLIEQMEAKGRKVVLATPPPMEPTKATAERVKAYNLDLAAYAIAIVELAERRKLPVLEITLASLDAAPDAVPAEPQWTVDGQKLTRAAYAKLGREIADAVVPASDADATNGFSEERLDDLQEAIQYKNFLFFQRHRPQNETYLFLFRKHEQGNNAVEIPQFDPLIEQAEARIAELATP